MKTFDCIPHNLLIDNVRAFDFDKKSLAFILVYIKDRKQETKDGQLFVISQICSTGSILDFLLLIIFVADLYYINDSFNYASCADDTTPYVCRLKFAEDIDSLEPRIQKIMACLDKMDS